MSTITRWEPLRNFLSLQDRFHRLYEDKLFRARGNAAALTAWAPAVDIYETGNDLVVKVDLPEIDSTNFGYPRREQHAHNSWRAQVRICGHRGQLSAG